MRKQFVQFGVFCQNCSGEHFTDEVEFTNVEEDMQGRDIMHFVCPVTKTETKSLVYRIDTPMKGKYV
jgi:hypothetical protein